MLCSLHAARVHSLRCSLLAAWVPPPFLLQVHNAELAGASAAIVFDDVYEALIIMSKPRDHPEPGIPAVFVSEKAGIIMRRMMTPGVTRVRIVPVSACHFVAGAGTCFL